MKVKAKPKVKMMVSHGAMFCGHCVPAAATTDNDTDGVSEEVAPAPISAADMTTTKLVCGGICCAREIPVIQQILKGANGIHRTFVNVPLRQVVIDHDNELITVEELTKMLTTEGFEVKQVIQNKAQPEAAAGTSTETAGLETSVVGAGNGKIPSVVQSTIQVKVLTINRSDVEGTVHDFLKGKVQALSEDKMTSFDIVQIQTQSEQTCKVTLSHNPLSLPLHRIIDLLSANKKDFEVSGLKDGAESVPWDDLFPTLDGTNNNSAEIEEAKDKEQKENEDYSKVELPKWYIMLSGVCWVLSYLAFLGDSWSYFNYLALLGVALGLPNITNKAYRTLRRGFMFDTNCLMFFAACGAVGLGDFQEAAAVAFLFAISDYLESNATTRAQNALSALIHLRPEYAFLVHPCTKQHLLVEASIVPVGALVSVKTGDKVPCDGIVVEGRSTVNEASLTGESRPVQKVYKDKVSGGTINCGKSHLMIQTTSSADNSAVARLIRLVEEAQAGRSQTEKLVDEFASVYTPIVVVSGVLMCTIPWLFLDTTSCLEWTHSGLVFLVVGCPSALVISTPVTYVAGLASAAQRGIVIKGGTHLETLGLVKSICFDKTGTLTQGSYALMQVFVAGDNYRRQEVMEFLMLMEERANHPLSLAILDGARREGIHLPKGKVVENHTFLAGEGISGEIDGMKVFVGNTRLFERLGLLEDLSEEIENMAGNWEAMAGTVGFMSIEGSGIVCAYGVADLVRDETTEVVSQLQEDGITTYMLTGDSAASAKAIGNIVGLPKENVKSELLPEDKLAIVSSLKKGGESGSSALFNLFNKREKVMMVGDGVNDAPALAIADIGVAMGVGAALAMETADVTLLDSNLKKLRYSLQLGRRVLWKIKENVVFSLLVKALMLGFAAVGRVELWVAILSDVGSMLCVTLNGMLLLPRGKIDHDEMGDIANVSFRSRVEDQGSDGLSKKKRSNGDAYGTFSKAESAALLLSKA